MFIQIHLVLKLFSAHFTHNQDQFALLGANLLVEVVNPLSNESLLTRRTLKRPNIKVDQIPMIFKTLPVTKPDVTNVTNKLVISSMFGHMPIQTLLRGKNLGTDLTLHSQLGVIDFYVLHKSVLLNECFLASVMATFEEFPKVLTEMAVQIGLVGVYALAVKALVLLS